jgi:hypothetical protein
MTRPVVERLAGILTTDVGRAALALGGPRLTPPPATFWAMKFSLYPAMPV